MNNLPAKSLSPKHPNPEAIEFNSYGLTIYRSTKKSLNYDFNYAVMGSSISEGKTDVTAKGRLKSKAVTTVHAMFGALWLLNFLFAFGVTALVTMATGIGFSAAYSVIALLIQAVYATLVSFKLVTRSFVGKGYINQVNSFVARMQLQVDMNAAHHPKSKDLPSTTVKKLHPSVAEVLRKLLALNVVDERDLVSKAMRKLESDATDDELYDWFRISINILTMKPDFPTVFLPELSSDLVTLEKKIRIAVDAEKKEQEALKLEESTMNRGYDEIDSTSSLTGALTWLGETPSELDALSEEVSSGSIAFESSGNVEAGWVEDKRNYKFKMIDDPGYNSPRF